MNIRISLQQFKGLLLMKSLFAVLLAAPGMVSALEIKDTNYPIPASAYFVAPNGKNTNSGKSPASPWPVAKALASAPNGATIVFRGGQYRNVAASINKRLTLQAYPHEQPWLKGSIDVQGWVADSGMWRKDGWNYSLPVLKSALIDPKYPIARYTDMVYINGVSLKQVGSKAQVGPGKFYVDNANNKLYIGNNPAGKTVEATAVKSGITIYNKEASNTVVRGLGFAHYADSAIIVGAARMQLENNTFVWNGFSGITLTASDVVVRGNTFSYNALVGIKGIADRVLVENNTISYNNIEHGRATWGAAGFKLTRTSGSVIRNNVVENNYATGIWLDSSCLNSTITNNTSRNNESIGIQYEISHKAFISGNKVYGNGAGIMLADSSGSQVSNNTLVNNRGKEQIIVKDGPRVNTNRAEIALGITWRAYGNVVKNNSVSF